MRSFTVQTTVFCAVVFGLSELDAIKSCRVTTGSLIGRHRTSPLRVRGSAENCDISVAPRPKRSPANNACSERHSWRTLIGRFRNSATRSIIPRRMWSRPGSKRGKESASSRLIASSVSPISSGTPTKHISSSKTCVPSIRRSSPALKHTATSSSPLATFNHKRCLE